MPKKNAVAIAVAALGLVLATTIAVAMNLGILSRTSEGGEVATDAGQPTELAAVAETPTTALPVTPTAEAEPETGLQIFPDGTEVVTVYVDEPAPVAPSAPQVTYPAPQAPAPQPAAPEARPPRKSAPKQADQPQAPTAAPTATPPPLPTSTPVQAQSTAPPAPTATTVPAPAPTATPPSTTYPVYSVGSAGDVALAFDGESIVFWGAYPNSGWEFVVEDEGPRKVKVKFRGGGDELEFQAELDGGDIKVEVGD